MLLADLKSMAAGLGIAGAGSMKKAQLVEAIKNQGTPVSKPARTDQRATKDEPTTPPAQERAAESTGSTDSQEAGKQDSGKQDSGKQDSAKQDSAKQDSGKQDSGKQDSGKQDSGKQERAKQDRSKGQQAQQKQERQGKQDQSRQDQGKQDQSRQDQGKQDQSRQDQGKQDQSRQEQGKQDQSRQDQSRQDQDQSGDDDGEGGSRRNRRRRGRERQAPRVGRNEPDTTILEDDVLVPAAGILDVLDNYAFVRTSGYLPGSEDVYLSLSMVRKFGLRRGDAVVGQVRQPREGERREKFNPMVRVDSVNGADPESARERPEFTSATPVHPHQRLRLATDSTDVTGRVIDIAAPVGKGQRGLIVTPPRAGTTSILRSLAASVTANNPECHLMVVLVGARPEEVTDFRRAVKGEVVASTFDLPPADHVLVSELAIERAKRLVELGHDVVVLLDSLTSLGRAYNLAAPANGRLLAGGVDASAVHPPKQLFGAARKLEDAGSLTILASVLVETGSATDELFFEELRGTANLELRLSSERAAQGLVPAVDPARSGTRHEEKLLAPAEGAVVGDLRRKLADATTQQAVEKLVASSR
ncbi:transcription termination factor Rho [Nocardioides seonyuensis]|uniref:Transcription termination factor Rho n=2 Tax=Nocardioides seonyuensis TaxID=2518371 RepID=A0A4P7IJN6_9ACTN|nr:transcription termination factor Rho [Nocardioides seonyuensis]